MSILDFLDDEKTWQTFLQNKKEKGNLLKREVLEFENFINQKQYLPKATLIKQGGYPFLLPQKKLVNKLGSNKNRVVYSFAKDESMILKLITFFLYRYDDKMCNNLFSFRKNFGVKRAVNFVTQNNNYNFCYKLDIKNYFNSIDVTILLKKLKDVLSDDQPLYRFLSNLLQKNQAVFNNEVVDEARGAMAGTPISPFLANIYLTELDEYFFKNNILYARYSDDIVVFANTLQQLEEYRAQIIIFLEKNKLEINTNKEHFYKDGEAWDFLGISFDKGQIDLSQSTTTKIKGKIRRKCRSLTRWKNKKNATLDRAVKATIRVFNKKFYETSLNSELTWCRWFFPLLTTDKSLKIIDNYFEENLRSIASGRHTKKNFSALPYQKLKCLGLRPLVNEFWKFKKQTKMLNCQKNAHSFEIIKTPEINEKIN